MRCHKCSAQARFAVDGNAETSFSWDSKDAALQPLILDLGKPREFGGLVLQWDRDS